MYLQINGLPKEYITSFAKFRVSAHSLQIEKGRHKNKAVIERLCPLCKADIETESHFLLQCQSLTESHCLLQCQSLDDQRILFFTEWENAIPSFINMDESEKFRFILQNKEYDVLSTSICICHIHKMFKIREDLIDNVTVSN